MTGVSANIPCNTILCRYDEIATKGKNRADFEGRLAGNIQHKLHTTADVRVRRQRGRIFILPPKGEEAFPKQAYERIYETLPRLFGLASFSPAIATVATLDNLNTVIRNTFPKVYDLYAADKPDGEKIRYAMRAHITHSDFPMSAQDLEIHFADQLLPHYMLQVDLNNPELRIDVEIRENQAFVSYERVPGPGGLPSGTSPKLIALLSGGIDSPVACHQAMKRGSPLQFITFHSSPYTPEATITKTARLSNILNQWQRSESLLAINLLPAQKAIRDQCAPRLRTVLYRRMMFRIATLAARVYEAQGLVTGESLGQVASQTLENMTVISKATDLVVLRPLLTFDKKETIRIAKDIDTLSVSNEETPDSCTVFAPDKPVTAAKLKHVRTEEEKLDIPKLITECLTQSSRMDPKTFDESPVEELLNAPEHLQAVTEMG